MSTDNLPAPQHEVQVGWVYRHFRTHNFYEVTGFTRDEETQEIRISYRRVGALETEIPWSRKESVFFQTVTEGDYTGPRFIHMPDAVLGSGNE